MSRENTEQSNRIGRITGAQPPIGFPEHSNRDWELEFDRELHEMTDEQLRYLFKAVQVTLDEREPAWYLVMNGVTTGGWRMTTCGAFRGPFTYVEARAALADADLLPMVPEP